MPFVRTSASAPLFRTQPLRWLALLVASLLLHLLLFGWIDDRLAFPSSARPKPATLDVALHAPPPAPPKVEPKPKPKPKPQIKSKPQPKPARPRPEPRPASTAPPSASLPLPAEAVAAAAVSDVETAPPVDTPPLAEVMPDLDTEQIAPRLLWQAVDPPPSAELRYDVYALKKEQHWYGNGVFRWESQEGSYRLVGEASASLLFFKITVLNFSSEGVINEYGIAPARYSEKPWRKPEMDTHFRHAQQKILFSSNKTDHPYLGGEQDRASVLWQLAGIGRAAPERFEAGAELEVVVAGTRDARLWQVRILGLEEIDTKFGKLQAWHLARVRANDAGEQRIDVWLAPEQNWYPVKIRQTDPGGDYLELSLEEVKPLAAVQTNQMETE